MEKKENILLVEVFENGVPIVDHIPYKKDINESIISYMESIKDPNHSIVGLYNAKESALDIVMTDDEFKTVRGISTLIHDYPSDIADTSLYAIVNSGYARKAIGFINISHKLMRKATKKQDGFGLIKRDTTYDL